MASRKELICIVLTLSLLLLSLAGCAPKQKKFQTTWFEWFDTFSTLTVYASSQAEFDRYAELCASYLEDYHKLLDIYHEYDGIQNLKTINDQAGEPVEIDVRLGDFLQFAKEIDALTDHTVNIGMGSALSLWHTARENATKTPDAAVLPDTDALAEAMLHTDLNCLEISDDKTSACLVDEQMSLDAGALGKAT
jgi:thiamine biosynthesis lipoprotein